MKRVVGIGLLASAFAPVVALLAVLRFPELAWAAWLTFALCAVAILLLLSVLRGLRNVQARTIQTETVRRADESVLAFTSSYVVPVIVVVFGEADGPTLAATVALVALLIVIYVRAGLYHLNPTLAVLGFRLYEVTATNGTVTMVLSRGKYIRQSGSLEVRFLGEDVAIQLGG